MLYEEKNKRIKTKVDSPQTETFFQQETDISSIQLTNNLNCDSTFRE